jgi:metal-responsive CopG/Arc/MetJ family transcriptional regulator
MIYVTYTMSRRDSDMASDRVESPSVKRIIISLPQDLLTELTELARDKGLSRASYIRMLLTECVKNETRERREG